MHSIKPNGTAIAAKLIVPAQRKAARLAGFTLLFSIALVIFSNYSVTFRYIVPDAAETARNLIEQQTAFRINIVCNLIYLFSLILMSTSFYVLLRPVNRNLALAAAFSRFVYALVWGLMAINTLAALRLLGDAAYLPAFESDQLQAMAKLHLGSSWDAYYLGLPFWGLASGFVSYLFFKSKYIPRALSVAGMIASFWCVLCAFLFLIFPGFAAFIGLSWFDVPLVLFEIVLGFWLLFRGLATEATQAAEAKRRRWR